jgi:saccharopine dehydrogenase-like NADP-dependent oxidoreductase
MLASTHSALYLHEGKEVSVPSELLFHNPFKIEVPEVGTLDVYPNRDSLAYIDEYGIPEVQTMLRGTLRLPGWCESMDAIKQLGLLDMQPILMANMSYFNLIERMVGTLYPDYTAQIAKFLNIEETSPAIMALGWLGFFSNELINKESESPFNITCDLMFSKMILQDADHDMVVLQHEMQVKYPDDREERITSLLIEHGSMETDTAISRTVAIPAAIVVDLILKDEITLKGLLRPFMREIWEPVLDKLEEAGIVFKEHVKQLV